MPAEIDEVKLTEILEMVEAEFRRASAKNDKFNSAHEGYAILDEEVDELWDEVKKKRKLRNAELMKGECKQIAAMAIRFMHDLL
jgi:hypothetical protein